MRALRPESAADEDPADLDPLSEQGMVDDKNYKAKMQCRVERATLREYYLTWAAPRALQGNFTRELQRPGGPEGETRQGHPHHHGHAGDGHSARDVYSEAGRLPE